MGKMNQLTIFLVLGILLTLAGFLGMCIYGAYTAVRGPTRLVNNYLGLWMNVYLFYNSLQTIYILKAPHPEYPEYWFFLPRWAVFGVYFAIETVLFLLISIGYGIYGRGDLSVWAVLNLIVCVLNIYLIKVASDFNTDEKRSLLLKIVCVINWILKILLLIFCCLLANGARVHMAGANYPPRGKIHQVKIEGGKEGRTYDIHIYCEGIKNASYPLIVFEGSGSHGYADYLFLQRVLTERKLRSCSWDKVGLGFSDYMYADQHIDHMNYYHGMMQAIAEQEKESIGNRKILFLGWAGGAPIVYDYVTRHPEMVDSIIYVDAGMPKNCTIKQMLEPNKTCDQFDEENKADYAGRRANAALYNGLGISWGLMSMFYKPEPHWPKDLTAEKQWFFLTEKTWTTQTWALEDLEHETNLFNKPIKDNIPIPISSIFNAWNDSQMDQLICRDRDLDEKACEREKNAYKFDIQLNALIAPRNGGVTRECTLDDCIGGYAFNHGPNWLADRILDIYANTPKR